MAPSLQRNHMFALAILLAVAAFLSTTNPSAAQQSSTSATLPAPVLTARASENAIELNWQAVDGAARYELASRPRGGDWLYLDNGTLTATTYTQTDPTAAHDLCLPDPRRQRNGRARCLVAASLRHLCRYFGRALPDSAGGRKRLRSELGVGCRRRRLPTNRLERRRRMAATRWGARLARHDLQPSRTRHGYDLLLFDTRRERD